LVKENSRKKECSLCVKEFLTRITQKMGGGGRIIPCGTFTVIRILTKKETPNSKAASGKRDGKVVWFIQVFGTNVGGGENGISQVIYQKKKRTKKKTKSIRGNRGGVEGVRRRFRSTTGGEGIELRLSASLFSRKGTFEGEGGAHSVGGEIRRESTFRRKARLIEGDLPMGYQETYQNMGSASLF